jgi:hypothetical protein
MAETSPVRAAWHQAQARVASGDLAGAREILQDQVRRATIADDPDLLDTRRRLAEVHYGLGDLPGARRELEEAVLSGEAHLGDTHPLMLALRARLGAVTAEIGNRYEARRHFAAVAEHGPAVLGATHTAVRVAEAYLLRRGPQEAPAGDPPPAWPPPPPGPPPPEYRPPG